MISTRNRLLLCFLGLTFASVLAIDSPRVSGNFFHETITRTGLIPGGIKDAPIDSKLNALSWRAVNEGLNKDSKSAVHFAPIKIIKAQSKVVTGTTYYLEVLVGESTCEKKTVSYEQFNSSRCSVKTGNDTKKQVCNFSAYQSPLDQTAEVTNKGCKPYTGTK